MPAGEANAMDCLLVFKNGREAAAYLGINHRTYSTHLARAYRRMEKAGENLGEGISQRRNSAIILWLTYWWSDEGKATLRNSQLTRPPLA